MVEETVKVEREGFVFQAARVGVWAPVIAIGLGFVVQGGLRQATSVGGVSAAMVMLAVVNSLMLGVGLLMSVVALVGVRKHGAKGLLVRGVVGLLLNGLLVGAIVWVAMGNFSAQMQRRMAGNWVFTSSEAGGMTQRLELRGDGRFELKTRGSGGGEAEVDGTWRVGRRQEVVYLMLVADRVAGGASRAVLGKVQGVVVAESGKNEMELSWGGERRRYRRE